jgi:hypothetical protein
VKKNALELQRQMANLEEKEKQLMRDQYEEGKLIKDKELQLKRQLEEVRLSKLNLLKNMNIPDKYQAELAKQKFL